MENFLIRNTSKVLHACILLNFRKDFEYVNNGQPTRGLAGQAWLNQVCRSWDTSVTEDDGRRTSNTAAHELGHSLGATRIT